MADTVGLMVYEGAGVTLVHILPIHVCMWINANLTNVKTRAQGILEFGNICFIIPFPVPGLCEELC